MSDITLNSFVASTGISREESEKFRTNTGISRREYADTIAALRAYAHKHGKHRLVVVCDPEVEIDDYTNNFPQATGVDTGLIELVLVVTNGLWPNERGNFQQAAYAGLGLDIRVTIGTKGTDEQRQKHNFELRNKTFATYGQAARAAANVGSGTDELWSVLRDAVDTGRPVILMFQSSLRDMNELWTHVIAQLGSEEAAGEFMRAAVEKIIFQGGACDYDTLSGAVVPHWISANNKWDPDAAKHVWHAIYAHKIRYDGVSNAVAAVAALDLQMLVDLPGPVGTDFCAVLLRIFNKFAFDPYYHWEYMPHLTVEWYLKIRCGMAPRTKEFDEALAAILSRDMPLSEAVGLANIPTYDAYAGLLGILPDGLLEQLGVLDKGHTDYEEQDHGVRWFGRSSTNCGGLDPAATKRVLSILVHYGAASGAAKGAATFAIDEMQYLWDVDTPETISNTVD